MWLGLERLLRRASAPLSAGGAAPKAAASADVLPVGLTSDQVDRFREQGYLSRIPVLTPEEVVDFRERFDALESAEIRRRGGTWENRSYRPDVNPEHPVRDWYRGLATHPRILAAVEALIGPDILIRNADLFLKPPSWKGNVRWHTDTAMPYSEVKGMVTAWVGLSPSTRRSGCLEFIPGSHLREIHDGPADRFNLNLNAGALRQLDTKSAVCNIMEAGQMSIHSFRTVHRSQRNRSRERRYGFAIRFLSAETSCEAAESGVATLVRGSVRANTFMLRPFFPMSWWEG
jgi:ectoine hydroxylase-related dioxygenase (phytanoyl-CoA dioxygenase family)